jgi:hypothetical protein
MVDDLVSFRFRRRKPGLVVVAVLIVDGVPREVTRLRVGLAVVGAHV